MPILEESLVTAILRGEEADYVEVLDVVKDGYFEVADPWLSVYRWINQHYLQFQKIPDPDTVSSKFKVKLLDSAEEPALYYAYELEDRAKKNTFASILRKGINELKSNQVEEAIEKVESGLSSLRENFLEAKEDYRDFLDWERRKEEYEKRVNQEESPGIPTPWAILNETILGWMPGEVTAFTARMGQGKTWVLCMIAEHAHVIGKNVLVFTCESPAKQLEARVDAISARVAAQRYRKGTLDENEAKRLEVHWQKLDKWKQEEKKGFLKFYGGSAARNVHRAGILIDRHKPDIVLWDSFYHAAYTRNWEDIAYLSSQVKFLAVEKNIPIIITTQLNRPPKKTGKNSEMSLENIDTQNVAFADAIAQDVDVMFALIQKEKLENNKMSKTLCMKSLKTRESESIQSLKLNFDLDSMDFMELESMSNEVDKRVPSVKRNFGYGPGTDKKFSGDSWSGEDF